MGTPMSSCLRATPFSTTRLRSSSRWQRTCIGGDFLGLHLTAVAAVISIAACRCRPRNTRASRADSRTSSWSSATLGSRGSVRRCCPSVSAAYPLCVPFHKHGHDGLQSSAHGAFGEALEVKGEASQSSSFGRVEQELVGTLGSIVRHALCSARTCLVYSTSICRSSNASSRASSTSSGSSTCSRASTSSSACW